MNWKWTDGCGRSLKRGMIEVPTCWDREKPWKTKDSRCLGRNSNTVPTKHKSIALPLHRLLQIFFSRAIVCASAVRIGAEPLSFVSAGVIHILTETYVDVQFKHVYFSGIPATGKFNDPQHGKQRVARWATSPTLRERVPRHLHPKKENSGYQCIALPASLRTLLGKLLIGRQFTFTYAPKWNDRT
jgi:hypothetical protein